MRSSTRLSGYGRGGVRRAIALLLVVAMAVPGGGAAAADPPDALREVVADRPDLATLLTDYTFRRGVASTGKVLDRDLHEFLVSRPDVGAALARLQGLGAYRVRQVGPRVFEGTDGEGAFALLRIIAETPGVRVFHARGRSEMRFFPDVSGEALVLLTTRYEETEGGDLARGQLTVYARLDNRILGTLLSLVIPVVGWLLDRKIAKAFLSESRAVEGLARDPEAVLERLAESEPGLGADVVTLRSLLRSAQARRPGVWEALTREGPRPATEREPPTPEPVGAAGDARP